MKFQMCAKKELRMIWIFWCVVNSIWRCGLGRHYCKTWNILQGRFKLLTNWCGSYLNNKIWKRTSPILNSLVLFIINNWVILHPIKMYTHYIDKFLWLLNIKSLLTKHYYTFLSCHKTSKRLYVDFIAYYNSNFHFPEDK